MTHAELVARAARWLRVTGQDVAAGEANLSAPIPGRRMVRRGSMPKPEPVACWTTGCYLAVDEKGTCPEHGAPKEDADGPGDAG